MVLAVGSGLGQSMPVCAQFTANIKIPAPNNSHQKVSDDHFKWMKREKKTRRTENERMKEIVRSIR